MCALWRGSCSVAVLLALASYGTAQEPDGLCLLQTGAALQRSSVPSDFFELEEPGSSVNLATAVRPEDVGRNAVVAPPSALFDVGTDAVPLPWQKSLGAKLRALREETLSLTEVSAPVAHPSVIPATDLQQEALAGEADLPNQDGALLEQVKAANDARPTLMSLLAAQPVQAMQVLATEPPLAAASPVPTDLALQPRLQVPEAQLAREETEDGQAAEMPEDRHELEAEETPEDAAMFLEQQANAGGEDSMDPDDQPSVPVEHKSATRRPPVALTQRSRQEATAREQFRTLRSMARRTHTSQTFQDTTGQRDLRTSRVLYDSPMHMLPREPQPIDVPTSPKEFLEEGADDGLRQTMERLDEDERRLLAALRARRGRDY